MELSFGPSELLAVSTIQIAASSGTFVPRLAPVPDHIHSLHSTSAGCSNAFLCGDPDDLAMRTTLRVVPRHSAGEHACHLPMIMLVAGVTTRADQHTASDSIRVAMRTEVSAGG